MILHTVPISLVPSITIFVRHKADCPRADNEFYRGCKCSKHLRWSHGGRQYRQAAKTRTWSVAEERRHEIEARFRAADPSQSIEAIKLEAQTSKTVDLAVELFLSDKRSQGLDEHVLRKYDRELTRFREFLAKRSKFLPVEIELEDLTLFRAGWKHLYPSSTTRAKVQERLRAFLRYCYEAQLIDRVPKLSPIKVDEAPTLPLSSVQYKKLLKAIPNEFNGKKAARVHALVRLMRYSGLAIRDAVTLKRDELQRNPGKGLYKVVTSRQKTGTHVSVAIPDEVA
jgi:integrase/recombinase XerD